MFNLIEVAEAHGGQQDNDSVGEMMGGSWGQGHYMGGFGFFIHLLFWVLIIGAGYYVYKTRCRCNKDKTSLKVEDSNKES